jgi:glutathione synthase/RimK-type ligase-like ATP-grasp enzyme
MKIILIGQAESKRTRYFLAAGDILGCPVTFIDFDDEPLPKVIECLQGQRERFAVKIDPPKYNTAEINQLPCLIDRYHGLLQSLNALEGICFLNRPQAIIETLDKYICKKRLIGQGVATTPFYDVKVSDYKTLREYIKNEKAYRIFIKPRFGSGAAGVVAYRCQPGGAEVIYTAMAASHGELINTKNIHRYTDSQKIAGLLDALLQQEVIIEKWIPKAQHQGLVYDLRVVYQFGRIALIVARQSKGPITNLHLNNRALDFNELGLSQALIAKIEALCGKALGCFPGLNSAGIDILISAGNQSPLIIEMNGQGDLIYHDIFTENRIYQEQIERMRVLTDETVAW